MMEFIFFIILLLFYFFHNFFFFFRKMALEQLRNDVTNHISQLPRCEDDYYICVFQNCSDPLRRDEADLDAYFQHLEQHSQNKHKLLQNMISTFNDTRITVAQKRAQYTPTANGVANNNNSNNNNHNNVNKNKKLKKPNNNKLNKNKQQPPAKKARQSKAATSAAATTATEAQTHDAGTPASDEQLVDKANAAARPKKRQKKTDVIDHGFDDLVAGIKVIFQQITRNDLFAIVNFHFLLSILLLFLIHFRNQKKKI